MKSIFRLTSSVVILLAILGFYGCKDGNIGPVGAVGKQGANAPGYDEAIKNGSIVFYLQGISPNGVSFTDTLDFKYSSSNLNDSQWYDEEDGFEVNLRRYLALDNYDGDDNIDIWIEPYSSEGFSTVFFEFNLDANIVTSDNSFFRLNDDYYEGEGGNTNGATFEDLKLDDDNGTFYTRFDFVVPANQNDSGHDLTVHGVINCSVFRSIEGG